MCSVFALCDGRGRTIVGERGGAFRRVVEGGEGRRLSRGQQQVFATNLLQTFDKKVSGCFLLVCIDRAISAGLRRRFLCPRAVRPLGYK